MTFIDPVAAGAGGGSCDFEEKRGKPRFALLLRSAKLVGRNGEYLCIVRDVSEQGAKLRLFHPLGDEQHFSLEIATGERFAVDVIWEKEHEAGFRFLDPIDVLRFVAEAGPFPKRPVRLKVSHEATIHVAGQQVPAIVHDLSRQGARIETDGKLAIGQKLRIDAKELPDFEATVCWRRAPSYGLVFNRLMSLDELANRAFRMQQDLVPVAQLRTA